MNPGFEEESYKMEADSLTTFLCAHDKLRAVLCHGSLFINEMRSNHQLQIAETSILGHYYLGATLLSANLKDKDVIRFKLDCTGPVGGLNVEVNNKNQVRGYLHNNPIDLSTSNYENISDLYGTGILSVSKTNHLTNKPFTGQTDLKYGQAAKDLAYYYTASEQIATSFNFSISYDDSGMVKGAGALLIQVLPGADEDSLSMAESIVNSLESSGEWFARGGTSEDFITKHFKTLSPKILHKSRPEFYCPCSKEQIEVHIKALSNEDVDDIISKNDFPIKTLCHNCGTSYHFSREESMKLLNEQKKLQ